jgi:protein TBF1
VAEIDRVADAELALIEEENRALGKFHPFLQGRLQLTERPDAVAAKHASPAGNNGRASSFQNYQSGTNTSQTRPLGTGEPTNSMELFRRAKAAAAKSSTVTRREGPSSASRKAWTEEEEEALINGMDQVGGPHWSQILGLYGENGTVSHALADRTQVQLKDKARNLKLLFLKTNAQMPVYFSQVTGELKTRAPSQAAKKEAEERAKQTGDRGSARGPETLTMAPGFQPNGQKPVPMNIVRQQPSATSQPSNGTSKVPVTGSNGPSFTFTAGSKPGMTPIQRQPQQTPPSFQFRGIAAANATSDAAPNPFATEAGVRAGVLPQQQQQPQQQQHQQQAGVRAGVPLAAQNGAQKPQVHAQQPAAQSQTASPAPLAPAQQNTGPALAQATVPGVAGTQAATAPGAPRPST